MISPISTHESLLDKYAQMQTAASSGIHQVSANGSGITSDFANVIRSISDQQNIASNMMAAVDAGRSNDVVGAMVASQKADLSFSMLLQIRNKVMNGIDDVMRMSL